MSDGSASANAGTRAAGGLFKAVHGAGEAIRGNINSFADSAGERIAGRDGDQVPVSASGERSTTVASGGMNELKSGLADLKGGSNNANNTTVASNAPASSTTTAPAPTTATGTMGAGGVTHTTTTTTTTKRNVPDTGAPAPMSTGGRP